MPVLIILAVLWAVVLVPPLLRSRSQHTADSIVDFNYKLDVLGRTNGNLDADPDAGYEPEEAGALQPRPALAPIPRPMSAARSTAAQRSAQRRREVSSVLAVAVVGSFLLAYVSHIAAVWALQILVDVAAVTYLALWAWLRSVQAERLVKVRYMPELRVPDLRVREIALRRSASS